MSLTSNKQQRAIATTTSFFGELISRYQPCCVVGFFCVVDDGVGGKGEAARDLKGKDVPGQGGEGERAWEGFMECFLKGEETGEIRESVCLSANGSAKKVATDWVGRRSC